MDRCVAWCPYCQPPRPLDQRYPFCPECGQPIHLHLNICELAFYMQDLQTQVEFLLCSSHQHEIRLAKYEVLFRDQPLKPGQFFVQPGQIIRPNAPPLRTTWLVYPEGRPGDDVLELRLEYEADDDRHTMVGRHPIRVLPSNTTPHNIAVQIGNNIEQRGQGPESAGAHQFSDINLDFSGLGSPREIETYLADIKRQRDESSLPFAPVLLVVERVAEPDAEGGKEPEEGSEDEFKHRALLDFGQGRRKIFVIPKGVIGFGRDKKHKNPEVDITLRLLPCRNKAQDPENWAKNLKISHCHGFLGYKKGRMHVGNVSSNGIYCFLGDLDNASMSGSVDEYAGTLDEDDKTSTDTDPIASLKLLERGEWSAISDVCTLSIGKTGLLHLKTRIFRNQGRVAAVRIERMSNWPQHTYVQLLTKVVIGNTTSSCIRLSDPSVVGEAAALSFDRGQFHLTRLDDQAPVRIDQTPLAPGQQKPLPDGCRVTVGKQGFIFAIATDEDFVNIL